MIRFVLVLVGALCLNNTVFAAKSLMVNRNSSMDSIVEVQQMILACTGKKLELTGVWSARMTSVIKSFQRSRKLSPTGTVNTATAKALNSCVTAKYAPEIRTSISDIGVNSYSQGTLVGISNIGSYNHARVMQGRDNDAVWGITAIARDGNVLVDSITLAVSNSGNGELRFDRVVKDVSVWIDGVEVGRKSSAEYSSDTGGIYRYRLSNLNRLIEQDAQTQIVVRISVKSDLDSVALSGASWNISTDTGYIETISQPNKLAYFGTSSTQSFEIQLASGGQSSETAYRVTPAVDTPPEQTIIEWGIEDVELVPVLTFDIAAQATDMVLERLPVTLATTAPYISSVARRAQLFIDGGYIAEVDLTTNSNQTDIITFGNSSSMKYQLSVGKRAKVQIYLHLNEMYYYNDPLQDFEDGDTVTASYTANNVSSTSIITTLGDTIASANRFGSAIGNIQTFYNTGASINVGHPTVDQYNNAAGQKSTVSWQIPLTISSVYDQLYMGMVAEYGTAVSGGAGMSFGLDDYAQPGVIVASPEPLGLGSSMTYSLASNAPVENNAWRLIPGVPYNFVLKVSVSSDADPVATVTHLRPRLGGFKFWLDSALSADSVDQLLPANQQTPTDYSVINNGV